MWYDRCAGTMQNARNLLFDGAGIMDREYWNYLVRAIDPVRWPSKSEKPVFTIVRLIAAFLGVGMRIPFATKDLRESGLSRGSYGTDKQWLIDALHGRFEAEAEVRRAEEVLNGWLERADHLIDAARRGNKLPSGYPDELRGRIESGSFVAKWRDCTSCKSRGSMDIDGAELGKGSCGFSSVGCVSVSVIEDDCSVVSGSEGKELGLSSDSIVRILRDGAGSLSKGSSWRDEIELRGSDALRDMQLILLSDAIKGGQRTAAVRMLLRSKGRDLCRENDVKELFSLSSTEASREACLLKLGLSEAGVLVRPLQVLYVAEIDTSPDIVIGGTKEQDFRDRVQQNYGTKVEYNLAYLPAAFAVVGYRLLEGRIKSKFHQKSERISAGYDDVISAIFDELQNFLIIPFSVNEPFVISRARVNPFRR